MGRDWADGEIERLRRADPDALGALIERYQHRLYRYLLRLTRDRSQAEDLFQQTWLRVIENIRRYDAARDFDTWLFSIAHNLAVDHLRRRHPEALEEEPAVDGTADSAVARERAERLAAAMTGLPAAYREAVTLRFEEEMKIGEIARVTGVPLSTAKSRLRRGLLALRELLERKI